MAKSPTPTPTPKPTPKPTPVTGEATAATSGTEGTEPAPVVADDAAQTKPVEEAPVPAPPPPPPEPKVVVSDPQIVDPVPEESTLSSTDPVENDDPQVATLKEILGRFKEAVVKPGKIPEDFVAAAKISAEFTRFVIQFPKVPILDALLAFFEENVDGVCQESIYMKGSSKLPPADNQTVGYLYGLFIALARKQPLPINSSTVIQVLKKPEIPNYYSRKTQVIMAQRAAAA